jgi:hypothetical protein
MGWRLRHDAGLRPGKRLPRRSRRTRDQGGPRGAMVRPGSTRALHRAPSPGDDAITAALAPWSGHYACVMLPALILGFVLSTTGAHVALAGGNESPTKTAALDCQGAIGGGSATSAENVTPIGGVVALQTSASNERALQTSRDPDAHGSVQRYFAKSPLYVRTEGRSAVIKVPQKARGHVALTWGNTDHDGVATRTFTVGPCAGGVDGLSSRTVSTLTDRVASNFSSKYPAERTASPSGSGHRARAKAHRSSQAMPES